MAAVLAFFISAVGHEILVGIPTHTFEGWAFWAMMGQIPLIAATEIINQLEQHGFRHVWGNGGKRGTGRQRRRRPSKPFSEEKQHEDGQRLLNGNHQHDALVAAQLPVSPPAQPPKQRTRGSIGNYIFWVSFCILGQPLSILLYYRSYLMRSHPELIENP